MITVAVAGCLTAEGRGTFPDADWPLLKEHLARRDVSATFVAWEDPNVDWAAFDLVVVRSTWTSVDLPERYLEWARSVDEVTRLENDVELLEWNLDKRHLVELERAKVPIAPTQWVAPGEAWDPPTSPFVVKPAISAGGRSTALYVDQPVRARDHVRQLHVDGQTVMVQRYLAAVTETGETNLVFIDGRLSHAMRVGALLEPDVGVMERPWEKSVSVSATTPTRAEVEIADSVMEYVTNRFGVPLYGRVDTVRGEADHPVVLEVEFVDPSLSLWAAPAAADDLAQAITRRVR